MLKGTLTQYIFIHVIETKFESRWIVEYTLAMRQILNDAIKISSSRGIKRNVSLELLCQKYYALCKQQQKWLLRSCVFNSK